MAEKFSLKDELFNTKKVHLLASELKDVYEAFNDKSFEDEVLEKFPELELKERINHIRDMLKKYLAHDYKEAVEIILKALPPELDPKKSDDDFGDFIYAPYGEFIRVYGCKEEYLKFSLGALLEITKRFSVEFAIRDFINSFPFETLDLLERCTHSPNYHQRRLASEGSRPKLPWGKKLNIAYAEPMSILDQLFTDKTRYVTRSVANHLNDIAKVDASLVIETLRRWRASNRQNRKEMDFMTAHALRTLVKDGNKEALALLGYSSNPKIELQAFSLKKQKIKVGEILEFEFKLKSFAKEALMIDYIIYFKTKVGKMTAKVHKIKKVTINKDALEIFSKKHPFRANMTTRKFYAGEHKIALQINGKLYDEHSFELEL